MLHQNKSLGQSFDLVLENPGDGLEISHPSCSSSLSLLNFLGPAIYNDWRNTFTGPGSRISTGCTGAILLVIAHPPTSPAEGMGFLMSLTE